VQDELVLVHLGTNEVYALNQTAARFWELLVEYDGRDEVVERLLTEFDVTREELLGEIERLLAELERYRLVERRTDAA